MRGEKPIKRYDQESQVLGNGTAFKLHSLPGCVNVLYLDFNGETVTNSAWFTGSLVAVPFSLDGDYTTFTDVEENAITDIWQRVSEDYKPFNIDVTTESPSGPYTSWSTTTLHAVITKSAPNFPSNTSGGVAYVGVFGDSNLPSYRPAWVYYNMLGFTSTKNIAEATSHELGHNFGLAHDGTSTQGYYGGLGSGASSWAPIMGVGYSKTLSQWSKGEYPDANNQEDDTAIISSQVTYLTKSAITFTSSTKAGCNQYLLGNSSIRNPTDVDVWNFNVAPLAGFIPSVQIVANPWYSPYTGMSDIYGLGNNLNILMTFAGISSNPIGNCSAFITSTNVATGAQQISIVGAGESSSVSNFSNYASAGFYSISVCISYTSSQPPTCASGACCDLTTGTVKPAGTVCRSSSDLCDAAEVCDGTTTVCPADVISAANVICRAASGPCDLAEVCNGTSVICPTDSFASSATICRASVAACDAAEYCTGTSTSCPTDILANSSTICGAPTSPCDAPEYCTGTSITCPASTGAFAPAGTLCRANTSACDVPEYCTGLSSSCPTDLIAASGVVCRPAVSPCDFVETCTGTSKNCPGNSYYVSGVKCRTASGPCALDTYCDSSIIAYYCPPEQLKPAGAQCRAANGTCDQPEYCTGTDITCPADIPTAVLAAGTVCRASVSVCDFQEICDGVSKACPKNSFTANTSLLCRAPRSSCDVPEYCTGTSATCPGDSFYIGGVCRPVAGPCDVAESCTAGSAGLYVEILTFRVLLFYFRIFFNFLDALLTLLLQTQQGAMQQMEHQNFVLELLPHVHPQL